MKKTVAFSAAIFFILASLPAHAQQKPAADAKPTMSKLPATPEQSSAPALIPQKSNDEQTAKPMMPVGETKPVDTRLNLPDARAAADAQRKPIIPPPVTAAQTQPETNREVKKIKVVPDSKEQE